MAPNAPTSHFPPKSLIQEGVTERYGNDLSQRIDAVAFRSTHSFPGSPRETIRGFASFQPQHRHRMGREYVPPGIVRQPVAPFAALRRHTPRFGRRVHVAGVVTYFHGPSIVRYGSAWRKAATPALDTVVRESLSVCKPLSSCNSLRPASVTLVPSRCRSVRPLSAPISFRPASVTGVSCRSSATR